MSITIINDGEMYDIDCAPETGAAYFEDEDLCQCARTPSAANVLISQADYDRGVLGIEALKIVKFMDDPASRVFVRQSYDRFACYYSDPLTGRYGIEYGDTPSGAMTAALYVIRRTRALRAEGEAA